VLRRDNWSSGRVAPPVGLRGGLIGRHRRGSVMKSVFQASGDTGKHVSDIDHALHALAIFAEEAGYRELPQSSLCPRFARVH
jgi:hypothetical protein